MSFSEQATVLGYCTTNVDASNTPGIGLSVPTSQSRLPPVQCHQSLLPGYRPSFRFGNLCWSTQCSICREPRRLYPAPSLHFDSTRNSIGPPIKSAGLMLSRQPQHKVMCPQPPTQGQPKDTWFRSIEKLKGTFLHRCETTRL